MKAAWPPAFIWVPALLVAVIVVLPVVYLVLRAGSAGAETWGLLFRARTLEILSRTLSLVIAVTAASLAISLPLAWLTTRTDLPFRRVWAVLTVLPLVIPSYVAGLVVIAALGRKGILQQALQGFFGLETFPDIYGFPGAMLSITLISYPYILITLQSSLRGLDPSLEEASHSLGYGYWATFRRVTLPLLLPAIATGSLLVALYTLRDFGAVSLLRYETFTWAIYLQYQTSFDRLVAAALSLVLVVIAVLILVIEVRTRGPGRYHRSTAGTVRPPADVQLGPWRWPALAFCSVVVSLSLLMPLVVLGYWFIPGLSSGETLEGVLTYALNSGYVSAIAAVIIAAIAIPVAILAVRYPGLLSLLVERSTYLGFALPGIVVALALVFFGANYATPIYQTMILLVVAYVTLFIPEAVGSIRSSLLQVSPSVEEAARCLGRSPLGVLASVTFPLVRPGVMAGAALVFLTTMKELPATLILSPIGFKTLATSVWAFSSDALFARAAAPALLLILISSVPAALFIIRGHRT